MFLSFAHLMLGLSVFSVSFTAVDGTAWSISKTSTVCQTDHLKVTTNTFRYFCRLNKHNQSSSLNSMRVKTIMPTNHPEEIPN